MGLVDSLYSLLPVAGQNAAVTVYGAYLQRTRYGGVFRSQSCALHDSQWWSSENLESLQRDSLDRLLNHVVHFSKYYSIDNRYSFFLQRPKNCLERLGEIPILTKSNFRKFQGHIEAPNDINRLTRISTSGTTGAPINVLVSRSAIQRNYAFFSRLMEWAGVTIVEPSVTFSGRNLVHPNQRNPPFWRYNAASNSTHFSSYHISPNTVESYLEKVEDLKPAYIDSYPSAIYVLARAQQASGNKYKIRPKAVFTSSETLLDHQRSAIEHAFSCTVFDQYGSAELAGFIGQCEYGTYHVAPEYGIVEVVDVKSENRLYGEMGKLILTGLINRATPLLRYEIGDMAIASAEKCRCNRHFPVIEKIIGRQDDVIVSPSGQQIGRLDPVFKGITGIEEAQIAQIATDKVTVRIVTNSKIGFTDSSAKKLRDELSRRLGPEIAITIDVVESIKKTSAGKFRSVVSEL